MLIICIKLDHNLQLICDVLCENVNHYSSDGSTRNRLINKPKFIYDDPTRKTSAPKLNEPDPALDALALSRERLLPGKPLDWIPPT